ncbi:Copia protein [Sesamum angolense]|uniref:Copia protein n=1 Tax=Sesamum angolense TaxID=2727404 RepID=A0AAE2C7G5_9LAMI|nr:Copia protein [Sesamum angolense]
MNLKVLRTDRGREYLSEQFKRICEDKGIIRHLTIPYTPQQNGIAERRNQTLLEMARSMMAQANIPISFWGYAILTEIESRDVDFLEEDFPSISEVKGNPELYELRDLKAAYLSLSRWITAMKEEMSSMAKNNVWELVDLPTGRKTIGNKWVLKVKRKADEVSTNLKLG